jgi:hypothetical protein
MRRRNWRISFVPLIIPSGGVSVKTGKFGGVKRNAERYAD